MIFSTGPVMAAPFVPSDEAQVLERLPLKPSGTEGRDLQEMQRTLSKNPSDVKLAVGLAQRYIEKARAESDPRYFGYAQAALRRWWDLKIPPFAVLILRATLRQSLHDFESALGDLNLALQWEPDHPQALVTRALILQVKGDYVGARKDCERLSSSSHTLIAATCLNSVTSLSGEAEKSYHRLRRNLEESANIAPGERLWTLTVLAEISGRRGDNGNAERHFQEALRLNLRDSYLLTAYADFLLDQGRHREVVDLLKDETRSEGLLLRLTLAEKALGSASFGAHLQALKDRFEASHLRGDRTHLREEARFNLELLGNITEAFRLAQENWSVQREPWDVRILLSAAAALKNPEGARPILDWLKQSRLEDVHLIWRPS